MKESFKYRWGGRERLKKPESGERGWRGGDRLCTWRLPVENSYEQFLRGTRAAILAVARWMTENSGVRKGECFEDAGWASCSGIPVWNHSRSRIA
jgi:hypothetical protein